MKKNLINYLIIIVFAINTAHSAESYNKAWSVATIIAPLKDQSAFKYYFEPQLRLINTPAVFNQLLLLGGLGYQFNPKLAFFMGYGWIETKTPDQINLQEKRWWEQLNWRINNPYAWNINSRTRLEERMRTDNSAIAMRLRQRIWLRIPLKHWDTYSFSSYDEVFFNLNHPSWVSPYSLEQNRAFIGISKQLSKSTILDLGYLNQYLRSRAQFRDNVLLISLSMSS